MKRKYFDSIFLGIIAISIIIGFITRLDIGILVFDVLCPTALIIIYLCLYNKEGKEERHEEENEGKKL